MAKTKSLLTSLMLLAPLAVHASPNMYGGEGSLRTFSAQTLGKGKVVISGHGMFSEDQRIYKNTLTAVNHSTQSKSNFNMDLLNPKITEVTGRLNFAMGVSSFFDFGVSIPLYTEKFKFDDASYVNASQTLFGSMPNAPTLNSILGPDGQKPSFGDPHAWLKLQYPMWEHSHLFDMAFLFGGNIPVGDKKRGLIPKEVTYITDTTIDTSTTKIKHMGQSYAYTGAYKQQSLLKAQMLWSLDLGEIKSTPELKTYFPLLVDVNYGLQVSAALPTSKAILPNTFILGGAARLNYKYIEPFVEYYGETRWKNFDNSYSVSDDPNMISGGLVFKYEARRGGAYLKFAMDQSLSNDSASTIIQRKINSDNTELQYAVTPLPKTAYHAQLGVYYRSKQDRDEDGIDDDLDKCMDVKGEERYFGCPNPDLDQDRVCDAWVMDKGMSTEFECTGTDVCPEAQGRVENQGCPVPDSDKDGICDVWVSDKGMLDQFIKVCKGIDKCQDLPGLVKNDGCPIPDSDKDGICDPWVSQNKLSDKFTYICQSTDFCQKVPGKREYNGCPSPDSDKDGICDEWVAKSGLTDKFKGECDATDYCPTVKGDLTFKGCQNPDADADKFCDAWVTEQNLSGQFESMCTGLDSCVAVPGTKNGCPNVDTDGDKVCDSWVAQKGLLEQFKSVCSGIDKCDTIAGLVELDGCKPAPVQLPPKAKIVLKGVNFASGKADLLPSSYMALEEVIKGLLDNPDVVVEIHGHTDNKGNAKTNEKLSLARAKSVMQYMVARGVKESQFGQSRGFGPKKPIASNKTDAGRAQNRRIELVRIK